MRLLIDACLPVELKDHFLQFDVMTAREMGWQHLKNGELLKAAELGFDALLTMDKSMPSQQKVSKYSIAVIILRARSNRLVDLVPLVPKIVQLLPGVRRGSAVEVCI